YSPCGGKGKCGKCKVQIDGERYVNSCLYSINKDISVVLPEDREMRILSSQYKNTIEVPFEPGDSVRLSPSPYGLAIDIGTTTIVYYIIDLSTGSRIATYSEMNPQATYGSDVISRIDYCNSNKNGLVNLQLLIIDAINNQINNFSRKNGIEPDSFVRIAIAGNTTMLHLFAGANPRSIALAPFKPQFIHHCVLSATETGINCNKEAKIHLLPSVSAYIGSDIVAGIASTSISKTKRYLYIDIGTNGEMALLRNEKIWCCATAAGPAFEGANISCGMGAFSGAICKYVDDHIATISNIPPRGICGSGLIDIIANMLRKGIIHKDGSIDEDILISYAERNSINSDISITQQDIREIQLAKGAVAAGIDVLLDKSGYKFDDIDNLILAGGFGNYLDIENAILIGLLPSEMRGRIIQIGNAAGTGALLAVKSNWFISLLDEIIDKTSYIELSYESTFPEKFVLSMNFSN
ncbi:MAG TPA: hypothetical protein DEQ09_08365, partial [Bacteroidales bacterium]|nr:hypothetical protein [Bacteroidales bacterium]